MRQGCALRCQVRPLARIEHRGVDDEFPFPAVGPQRRQNQSHHAGEQDQRHGDALQSVPHERRGGAAIEHQVREEAGQQEEHGHAPQVNEVEQQQQRQRLVVVRRPHELDTRHPCEVRQRRVQHDAEQHGGGAQPVQPVVPRRSAAHRFRSVCRSVPRDSAHVSGWFAGGWPEGGRPDRHRAHPGSGGRGDRWRRRCGPSRRACRRK